MDIPCFQKDILFISRLSPQSYHLMDYSELSMERLHTWKVAQNRWGWATWVAWTDPGAARRVEGVLGDSIVASVL